MRITMTHIFPQLAKSFARFDQGFGLAAVSKSRRATRQPWDDDKRDMGRRPGVARVMNEGKTRIAVSPDRRSARAAHAAGLKSIGFA
jgi:hypothetical protein